MPRRCCTTGAMTTFIVFTALLLDNMLNTSIVPILPNFLRDHENSLHDNTTVNPLTTTVAASKKWKSSDILQISQKSSQFTELRHYETIHNSSTSGNENTKCGLLFASKTFVQMLVNLVVGSVTNRVGYTIPMFCGFLVLLVSNMIFAFGQSYAVLFFARSFQGVGSAFSSTSGMGLLASLYQDQADRSRAQSWAFSGLAIGVLLGPPYGGFLYEVTNGKALPYLILAGVAVFELVLQMLFIRPKYTPEADRGPSMFNLLCDPYILMTAIILMIASLTVAVQEQSLPIWMYHQMNATAWLQGAAFVPSTLSYTIALQVFGALSRCFCFQVPKRWFAAFLGLLVLSGCSVAIPYCENIYQLIGPLTATGIGLALVSSTMMPHMAYLMDHRHVPVYGIVSAITDNAFCIAFALGPAVSGPLIDEIGFTWTMRGVAAITLISLPLTLGLIGTPGKQRDEDLETQPLIERNSS